MSWEADYLKLVDEMPDPPEECDVSAALSSRARITTIEDQPTVYDADKKLIAMAKYTATDPLVPASGEGWYRNLKGIARGEYPLDKLPAHVRELAEELYYAD